VTTASEVWSRRERRRLLHQELSREQLLDAAEEVFAAKGYHDATLKEVAALAEFSVGSVYSFFENKDDLLLGVWLRRGAEFLPALDEALADATDPVDELHRLVDFQVDFFRRHPHFGRLYLRSAGSTMLAPEAPTSDRIAENIRIVVARQTDLFARGQRAGLLRPGDPGVLARLLSGIVQAYQAADPLVSGDPGAEGRLTLTDLHAIVDGAFGAR
jgi:TetR/AcrR family transcriptional regulator